MLYWHSSSLTTHILILNVNWKLVLRLHLLNVNQRQFEISCLKKSSYLLDVLQAKFSAVCTVSCYACQVLPQQFYFTVLTYSRCDYVWDFFFFFFWCAAIIDTFQMRFGYKPPDADRERGAVC